MSESIVVALITGGLTLLGVIITNSRNQAEMGAQLDKHQAVTDTIGTAAVMGDVNCPMVASASVLAGVLPLLTSVAGLPDVE